MIQRRSLLHLVAGGAFAGGMGYLGARLDNVPARREGIFNVKDFGAKGDGRTIDSGAFNRAIQAAASAGGGMVLVPRGVYASYSIRLESNIRLYLETGSVIEAANPATHASDTEGYDPPEINLSQAYQDFGHSHWHNSLIWGENLHNITIEGDGLIAGHGLVNGDFEPEKLSAYQPGVGNKVIALKKCSNVTLRDFSILRGGHFGILATGLSDFTFDGLKIDTNRDGMDIDCCRNGHITKCIVNSPNDDGICLKSSYALGEPVATEDITISGCTLMGDNRIGTMLDGTFQPIGDEAYADFGQRTGRIKLGTESNGGFRRITMKNNLFHGCRGIALETVDGGDLEDIVVDGLTMRDVRSAPLFIRLGARLRGPAGTVPGRARRISLSNVVCEQTLSAMPMIIAGLPGYPIEDVTLDNIRILTKGGGTKAIANLQPPEADAAYPDPECFGRDLPACGLFARHVKNLTVKDFEIACIEAERRPVFWMKDVQGATIPDIRSLPRETPLLKMEGVTGLIVGNTLQSFQPKRDLAP
jgi:polygalacturonase